MTSAADRAEALVLQRAWGALALGALFVASQAASLGDPALGRSPVTHFAAWIAWALVLAVFLVWSAGLFDRRGVAAMANDEGAADHRRRALGTGFWGAVGAAFAAYAASFYEPLAARDACRLIVTAAVAPALLRFGWLELRSLRHG